MFGSTLSSCLAASHHFFGRSQDPLTPLQSMLTKNAISNSFRINTYKTGEGGTAAFSRRGLHPNFNRCQCSHTANHNFFVFNRFRAPASLFADAGNSSPFLPTASALFAKPTGVLSNCSQWNSAAWGFARHSLLPHPICPLPPPPKRAKIPACTRKDSSHDYR